MNTKFKRIFAWVSIVLLALMYILLIVLALMGFGINNNLFGFCLMGTIAIPLFAWVVLWLINRAAGKKMMHDPEKAQDEDI